jgi:hypothetical protein
MTLSRISLTGIAAFAIASAMPAAAFALTAQGQQMMRNWAASDRCVAQAQKQFPDYTAEALAKRDQALQRCLTTQNLAPRAPQAPQQ